ncbi:hypothetical protein OsJ_05837 [Oryza sativa Japonica Group]|uniref:Serine aminopeptidase S33 domain-containing protein n=1 Tax=Oryza sativa subsp. japonica TaxID=39947 RepID=A3A4D6_ORYSJ|nr:hypothetical protein OsJ_05837 [Oryza sativa Japonica Group]
MAPPPPPPTATKYFWGDSPEPDEYYASLGLRHAEAYFQSPCGRLFTHSFHPLSAASDGDVKGVVFMSHGYGSDSSWMFQNIAISYARWGYAVFCADLLGHGRSDGVRGYLGDTEAVARAALSFFLSVRRSGAYASLPAFLFGESWAAPPPCSPTSAPRPTPADTWAVMPDKRMVGRSIRDPAKLRVIASNPRLYRGSPRVGTMRELARVTALLRESFGEVAAPFLVVHGTDDGVTSPEGSRMLYERPASEDKSLILYDGMYQSVIQGESDENRDRVLADMRAWIDERVRR